MNGAAPTCSWCEFGWPREWKEVLGQWGYWHWSLEGAPLKLRLCDALRGAPSPRLTPTQRILSQIDQAQKRHGKADAQTCHWCGLSEPWPCDASRLARQLEEAVKALEKYEGMAIQENESTAVNWAARALSRIEQLGGEEGK